MNTNFVSCGCCECKLIIDYLNSYPNLNEKLLMEQLHILNNRNHLLNYYDEDIKSDLTSSALSSDTSFLFEEEEKTNCSLGNTFLKLDVDEFMESLEITPPSPPTILLEEPTLTSAENNISSNQPLMDNAEVCKSVKQSAPKRRRGSNNSSTNTKKRTKRCSFPGETKVIVWKWNKSKTIEHIKIM